MAATDGLYLDGSATVGVRRAPRLVMRAMLCGLVALFEGGAAMAIVVGTSMVYHLLVLGTEWAGFPWLLYLIFGVTAGAVFATFSAIACGHFLHGERHPRPGPADGLYGWTAAIALTLLVAFLSGAIGDLSRVSLTSSYIVGVPAILLLRRAIQRELTRRISDGALHYERVAIVGSRANVVKFLIDNDLWRHGRRLSGILFLDEINDNDGVVSRGAVAEFAREHASQSTDYIVVVGPMNDVASVEHIITEMRRFALNVVYSPSSGKNELKILDVVPIGTNNALLFMRKPMSQTAIMLKRATDIVISTAALILLSPLLLGIAISIRLESPGPILFRQERRGFNGETFVIWKFRSMRVTESGRNMRQAVRDDPRVTKVGRFIRSTSIDELPQLVNVLVGQMSIVGPRPHAISHDEALGQQLATYAHRQRIKPGITGWAQVNGYRGETRTFDQVEGRTIRDLYYIDNWSLYLDAWIIFLTFFSPATRRNAH